ncbi:MAG TPA: sigma-70 family RNA polymerase sigma factor [Steroidobacteraceae bacterium]|nr:sigma-70 family RNA polymerase sigma factor [Gammaproteobacteria bacterium]HEV2284843.1 sigma-70 family RNA polymerase sigma factor [Steroidobacteraceae bacterium]
MNDADPSDEALVGRYVRGDAQAFTALYRRHELRVWRYLERNVGNRALAEELMQEVWFAVARDAEGWRPTARFTTWLFAIARNRLVDALRARRPQLSLDVVGHEDAAVVEQLTADAICGPLAAAEAGDRAAALKAALARLAPEQRDALLLQLEGDLSVEEVAAITGTGFETAKSRLRYARTRLRELLSEHV